MPEPCVPVVGVGRSGHSKGENEIHSCYIEGTGT